MQYYCKLMLRSLLPALALTLSSISTADAQSWNAMSTYGSGETAGNWSGGLSAGKANTAVTYRPSTITNGADRSTGGTTFRSDNSFQSNSITTSTVDNSSSKSGMFIGQLAFTNDQLLNIRTTLDLAKAKAVDISQEMAKAATVKSGSTDSQEFEMMSLGTSKWDSAARLNLKLDAAQMGSASKQVQVSGGTLNLGINTFNVTQGCASENDTSSVYSLVYGNQGPSMLNDMSTHLNHFQSSDFDEDKSEYENVLVNNFNPAPKRNMLIAMCAITCCLCFFVRRRCPLVFH